MCNVFKELRPLWFTYYFYLDATNEPVDEEYDEKLFSLFTDAKSANGVAIGLIEATAGCRELSLSPARLTLPLCGFLITFGGASILAQQLAYLTKAGVKTLYFIFVKLLQGLLCFAILLIFI